MNILKLGAVKYDPEYEKYKHYKSLAESQEPKDYSKTKRFLGNVAAGVGGGLASAVVTAPVTQVYMPRYSSGQKPGFYKEMTDTFNKNLPKNKHIKVTPKNYYKAAIKDTFMTRGGRKQLLEVMKGQAIKSGIGMGAAFTANYLLRNALNAEKTGAYKSPSVYRDLKIEHKRKHEIPVTKSNKPKATPRWTPIDPEARLTWSKLSPQDKRRIGEIVKTNKNKLQSHNKNYIISQLQKGRQLDSIEKKVLNQNKALF